MTIFPVGFLNPRCATRALGAGRRLCPGHGPTLTWVSFPWIGCQQADINGFERRNDPPGVCKTFVRKGKKKQKQKTGCSLGAESRVTEILIQLLCSSAQFPFSAPCKECMFSRAHA